MSLIAPRPVGDFFGPIFEIRLTSLQGTDISTVNFDQGLTSGRTIAPDTTGGVLARIDPSVKDVAKSEDINDLVLKINSSLTAESKAGSPFHFVLTMTPEYQDGLALLNLRAFGYTTVAQVRWGYSSDNGSTLTRWHTFRNIQPKAKFAENIEIILDGWDMFSDTSSRRTLNLNRGESALSFIERLAKRVKYSVDVAVDLRFNPNHALFEPPKFKCQQTLTDLQLVNSLLRELSLTFAIRGAPSDTEFGVIDIYDPKTSKLQSQTVPDYTFKWRQELTSDRDIPVTSMDANFLQYFFQPPAGRGLNSISTNAETGEINFFSTATKKTPDTSAAGSSPMLNGTLPHINPTDVTVSNQDGSQLPSTPAASSDSEETGTTITFPPNDDVENIAGIGVSVAKETEVLSSPILKIKAPGVPDMFPGLLVRVSGMADAFDGIYNVLTTKHSISNGGYDMDVELIRWTTRSSDVGKPSAGDNTTPKTPDPVPKPLPTIHDAR